MINRIIEWSLRNRFLVSCGVFFIIGFGIWSIYRTPVDAIPDLSENQVIVFADWPGAQPAGSRRPGYLSAVGKFAGVGGSEGRPRELDVRFHVDHRHFLR
jgi:hypothetical protein